MKESFSLQMINNISYIDAHKKIGETTSDNAGNFAGSAGEEHNLESERKSVPLQKWLLISTLSSLRANRNMYI